MASFGLGLLVRQHAMAHRLLVGCRAASSASSLPVITLPVPMQKKALRRMDILRKKGGHGMDHLSPHSSRGDRKKPPVIACRRSELNHYLHQAYPGLAEIPLASRHWHSRRSNGDYFRILPHGRPYFRRTDNKKHNNSVDDFGDYPLAPALLAAMKAHGFRRPTLVQETVMPDLLAGRSSLVTSETGGGKTLAYLVPILQRVAEFKAMETRPRPPNSPLALILVPGLELASQIYQVARNLSGHGSGAPSAEGAHGLGLDVRLEQGRHIRHKVLHSERTNVDVLVGSFGGVTKLLHEGLFRRNQIRHLVYDEADTLLDDTFNEKSVPFLKRQKNSVNHTLQIVLVASTMPTSLQEILPIALDSDRMDRHVTHGLHGVLPHVAQTFIRAPCIGKEQYLLEEMEKDVDKRRKILIFSNKTTTANFVAAILREQGLSCLRLHSGLSASVRQENLDRFLAPSTPEGDNNILSCTDLASRGIDTSCVHHLINYDFPRNMFDYVQRMGRIGRAASPDGCKATHLVGQGVPVTLVQKIEEAVRTRAEIPAVNSNVVRIIRKHGAYSEQSEEEEEGE